ncbi:hypothetical protein V6Z11_A05G332000 [Gossypium hirsutum]
MILTHGLVEPRRWHKNLGLVLVGTLSAAEGLAQYRLLLTSQFPSNTQIMQILEQSKACNILGWFDTMTLTHGLVESLRWHKNLGHVVVGRNLSSAEGLAQYSLLLTPQFPLNTQKNINIRASKAYNRYCSSCKKEDIIQQNENKEIIIKEIAMINTELTNCEL